MNRVCHLVQRVGMDEVFNLSPQHVESEHKPPPPPPRTRPRITTKRGDPSCVKGDAKSPSHVPAVKSPPVERADGAPDEITSDAGSDQDQVGPASLSPGTAEGHISHSGVTAGNYSVKSTLLSGGGLWARILNQGIPRYAREILPPEKGDHLLG